MVAKSSAEAELRALAHGICDLWGYIDKKTVGRIEIHSDNAHTLTVITRQQFPLLIIPSFTTGRNVLNLIKTL